MTSIRLLPIVVLAAFALLVLKTVGIATGGGYTLTGVGAVTAQEASEDAGEAAQPDRDEQIAAAEAAAEALFRSTTSPSGDGQLGIEMWERDGTGEPARIPDVGEQTQQIILQRLSERRAELDALEAELDTRLAVIEAAEVRIEERMAELSEIETRINALVETREAEEAEQFAAIVAMYENMRASDAARIFNDLDIDVLTRVGRAMNPRRLGPVMAAMDAQKAQRLTILLARGDDQPAASAPDAFSDLPQIVGQ